MLGFMTIVFALCMTALPQVSSLYFANIIFYILLLLGGRFKVHNRNCMYFFFLFFATVICSVLNYVYFLEGTYELWFIVQFVFAVQYFVLFIDMEFDKEKFEKWYKRFALLLAAALLVTLPFKVNLLDRLFFFIHYRMWGNEIFSGWPNTTGLPLVFAMYLYFASDKNIFSNLPQKILLFLGIFTTTSRTTLLGCALIVLYFAVAPHGETIGRFIRQRLLVVIVGILAIFGAFAIILAKPDFVSRLFYTEDRQEIFDVVMKIMPHSPFFGFGGTSIDAALAKYGIETVYVSGLTHTHNFLLENLQRYGLFGLVFFLGMLVSLFRGLRFRDTKAAFLIFWFMALFQIYVRDFTFLFMIGYICQQDKMLWNRSQEAQERLA